MPPKNKKGLARQEFKDELDAFLQREKAKKNKAREQAAKKKRDAVAPAAEAGPAAEAEPAAEAAIAEADPASANQVLQDFGAIAGPAALIEAPIQLEEQKRPQDGAGRKQASGHPGGGQGKGKKNMFRKGLQQGGAVRHRKILHNSIQGITRPGIRRLARRGGVKRISGMIYEETRGVLKVFLERVLADAVILSEYRRAKTVTSMDVVEATKRQGRTLYGFGG
jgi:histone H4